MRAMKRLLSFLLLSFLSLSAFADPVVSSINPATGPASGGTEVTIRGTNLLPTIVCIVPCPATVTFGTVTVTVKSEANDKLVVVTPSHPHGTVDVIVNVAGEDPIKLSNAFTFDGGAEAGYEQVLLPVYLDGVLNGANGTQWRTDFWIRNNGTDNAALAPWVCPAGQACPPVHPLTYMLQPGLSLHNLPAFLQPPTANPSRLLYVGRAGAQHVSFGLRFADVSRASLNGGTDLPVIRESELLTRPAQLFNVPLNQSAFRVLLRVYDVAYTISKFRVTVYPQSTGNDAPIHSAELTTTSRQTGDFRTEAAYAQFDVTDLLRLERSWPEAVRIEVTALTPGSRYWTFASVTNNETQLVTLVTPQ